MTKLANLLISVLIIVLLASCAHTNDLAKHNVSGSSMLYKEVVKPEAKTVKIERYSTTTDGGSNDLLDVISAVGSSILTADLEDKLEKAIDTKRLLYSISDNLAEAIQTYLDVSEVESLSNKPDFICNISLDECKLNMNQYGVYIKVEATASITKRKTGEIVWEKTENKFIPLEEYYESTIEDASLESVFNVVQLASLDAEQINQIIDDAASGVGTYMAETLRDDVAEAHKQRTEKQ